MEVALIGLNGSGKTTLFRALTGGGSDSSGKDTYGRQVDVGVAKVEDQRLEELAKIYVPQKVTPAEIVYLDIPVALSEDGRQMAVSGQFLNQLQTADAFLQVVRVFDDPTVPHPVGSVDPLRDFDNLQAELAFSDLIILERRVNRIADSLKGARGHERDQLLREQPLIQRVKEALEDDVPVAQQSFTDEESSVLSGYGLLTAKPLMAVLNAGEEDLADTSRLDPLLTQLKTDRRKAAVAVSAQLEDELSQLSSSEEAEFRESMGLGHSSSGLLVRETLELVGMSTFLTVGPDEVRGWLINKELLAVDAAGKVHSDIERGFIRAEVISYADFMACGSMAEARKQGRLRSEGKGYPVKDGDMINFLFNV